MSYQFQFVSFLLHRAFLCNLFLKNILYNIFRSFRKNITPMMMMSQNLIYQILYIWRSRVKSLKVYLKYVKDILHQPVVEGYPFKQTWVVPLTLSGYDLDKAEQWQGSLSGVGKSCCPNWRKREYQESVVHDRGEREAED